MGLTERHWFEDEKPELTEKQLEDILWENNKIFERGYQKGFSDGKSAILREQEPHLLTTDDFVRVDHYGYLAVWAEERNGDQFWKIVTIRALEHDKKRVRYWSSRPTNEQMEAVKWDG